MHATLLHPKKLNRYDKRRNICSEPNVAMVPNAPFTTEMHEAIITRFGLFRKHHALHIIFCMQCLYLLSSLETSTLLFSGYAARR